MNLLITGAWSDAKNTLPYLEQNGHKVWFLQQEADELPCSSDLIEGVVCNGLFLHHPIDEFKNLKYIQLTSAGFDRVPMDYVQAHNIEINNARGVYSVPMAEFALCGVLQLYKQSHCFHRSQQQHRWEKNRNLLELCGKTVCILGCGSVGTECAIRFSALGCQVIGVDLYPTSNTTYSHIYHLSELNTALKLSDIIILTLPLTPETHHLFDHNCFAQVNRGTVLVNIARGPIVDTNALLEALESGCLRGAVLDVFEEEPLLSNHPLWDIDNVIITPHNSFVGENNASRLTDVILRNLSAMK